MKDTIEIIAGCSSEKARAFLKSMLPNLQAGRLSYVRFNKLAGHLRGLERLAPAPLETLTEEQAVELIAAVRNNPAWILSTKHDYVVVLKRFFRFADGGKTTRAGLIRDSKPAKRRISEEQTISRQELDKLASACTTRAEEACLRLLYETGARSHEFTSLKIADVVEDAPLLKLKIHGTKTKYSEREIPIGDEHGCKTLLVEYLAGHPKRDKPTAPLWVLGIKQKPLSDAVLWKFLRSLAQTTGFNKPIHAHWFRHSRASELAGSLAQTDLNSYFGWSPFGNEATTYIHREYEALRKKVLENSREASVKQIDRLTQRAYAMLQSDTTAIKGLLGCLLAQPGGERWFHDYAHAKGFDLVPKNQPPTPVKEWGDL